MLARVAVVLLLCLAILPACKRRTPLDTIIATAASPTGGRTTAAPLLVADWQAGKVTLDDALNKAFEQLDAVKAGTPPPGARTVPTSKEATEFAGTVLDATRLLDGQLPIGPEKELFWMRVGGLSFAAAEEARANGRLNEALDLVFAGHKRWKSETYWYMHPTHDGLASLILAESGNRSEAVNRLRQRVDLSGLAKEVYETLSGTAWK